MIILDSDHLSILRYHNSERALKLIARLNQATERPIATSVANVEEAMRGWLSAIAKERRIERQIPAYRELSELFTFFLATRLRYWIQTPLPFLRDSANRG